MSSCRPDTHPAGCITMFQCPASKRHEKDLDEKIMPDWVGNITPEPLLPTPHRHPVPCSKVQVCMRVHTHTKCLLPPSVTKNTGLSIPSTLSKQCPHHHHPTLVPWGLSEPGIHKIDKRQKCQPSRVLSSRIRRQRRESTGDKAEERRLVT